MQFPEMSESLLVILTTKVAKLKLFAKGLKKQVSGFGGQGGSENGRQRAINQLSGFNYQ
tara:strand:+ start:835 stop:1011 length:177 start_codon:yes stop_codon:yes gene_type:complete